MKEASRKASAWVYEGVWSVLSNAFRVPRRPPELPNPDGGFYRKFHPSERYLDYLKLYFWVLFAVVDLAILIGWLVLWQNEPRLAWMLALPAFLIAVVPDVIAYVALHLRYDTMWYVMTDRSLRCRRGVWVVVEHTITFENVQNVEVHRGPVQYLFGIWTVTIETAGASEGDANKFVVGNKAIMQGIDNPEELRGLILERVRRSRSAGLGDDEDGEGERWTPEHVGVLHELLGEVKALG